MAPSATYRIQLGPGFGFAAARELIGYLGRLGVSHVYLSPYLQATRGSGHGYDIVDPHRVSADLGGAGELELLREALRGAGMAEVVDTVPNHLAVGSRENRWWWDVLARGPASPYSHYFDIDWHPPTAALGNRLLVPVLRGRYRHLLATGGIRLVWGPEAVEVAYLGWRLPLSPDSQARLLRRAAREAGLADPAPTELAAPGEPDPGQPLDSTSGVAPVDALGEGFEAALGELLKRLNRDPMALHDLLSSQHYQLANWRSANRHLNYRRFFDVTTLAGLRMEDPDVLADRDRLLLAWLETGQVTAVRVDHIDGLGDPLGYLARLRQASPDAWVVTEKILAVAEHLPPAWPVAGTTGYDFLRLVGGVLLDRRGEAAMTELYSEFTGELDSFDTIRDRAKRGVLAQILDSELERLTTQLAQICARDGSVHRRSELREALLELVASFPVYRTYVAPDAAAVDPESAARIQEALARAHRSCANPDLLRLLGDLLLQSAPDGPERQLLLGLQQLTGPAMAKGVEDTAFYRYLRLISLNEVGDDPGRFGVPVEEFHRAMQERQERWPTSLNATSTHDTKRSEDVRARLHLLAEVPWLWAGSVRRWAAHNDRHRQRGMPSRKDEYYLYQTLVGAWPIARDRLHAALMKSAREAKAHTSWQSPNPAYEQALVGFADGCLDDPVFATELAAFVAQLVGPGRVNSLSQTLIKLTAPGVPDIYQGTELWDHSLVDPDNRRAVDYGIRRRLLAELESGAVPDALADSGLSKLWLIRSALRVRAQMPNAFGPSGAYRPLPAAGSGSDHVLAFARVEKVIAVAQRLPLSRGGRWGDTALTLPAGSWVSQLDGRNFAGPEVMVADLLGTFPVALLVRGPA